MKLGILFTGGGHEMKKLSEILGLENLKKEANFIFKNGPYKVPNVSVDEGHCDGIQNSIDVVNQFEIDYEFLLQYINDCRDEHWADFNMHILECSLPPEKLFKKKVV